jgi:hypothetical protein
MRTPRGGTPLRERRSSNFLVDDNSQLGSDPFLGSGQHFDGAKPRLHSHHVVTICTVGSRLL